MLSIYSGRENLDKEKFIFDHIEGKTLLLVPDQFTLGAEQRAFSVLGVRGLLDLEVLSPSRLGHRILSQTGGSRTPFVDQVGRHMVLTRILRDEAMNLEAFRGLEGKPAFALAVNDMISEMKQFSTTPKDLEEILGKLEEPLLKKKLGDIHRIYSRYEESIENHFADTEDRMTLYISRLIEYEEIRGTRIWIWGFDYFTPKNLELIRELMKHGKEVNLVLTLDEGCRDEDLFSVTRGMKNRILAIAREEGISAREIPVPEDYKIPAGVGEGEKRPSLISLEQELFALPMKPALSREGVTLVRAASLYGETESAAAHILSLVRDQGLRFRDIGVVCNDLEVRGSIMKRTFEEYGIPVFLDTRRSCTHNPLVESIASVLDLMIRGWRTEDVFRLIKTGLGPLLPEEAEELENYAIQYRIRGSQWKKPFRRGLSEYGEEGLLERNQEREKLVAGLASLEEEFRKGKKTGEKLRALYRWMSGEGKLPEKLESLMEGLEKEGQQELAGETSQIWQTVVDLMDQMMLLLGEEELPDAEFATLMNTGFSAMEIGLIPPTVDRLTVGTMQRTRFSSLKALVVLGANDGILPQEANREGLLSEDEKRRLYQNRIQLCKLDELMNQEEKLGIYRMLSLPRRDLWIGCSATDEEGKDIKPSVVFESLLRIFSTQPEKDILSREDGMELLSAPQSGLRHLAEMLRRGLEGEAVDEEWQEAATWYRGNEEEALLRLEEGIFHTGKQEDLEKELAEALYQRESGELRVSPSGLESYSRCPFYYLMNYGIRPEERRIYQVAGREIGDLYHQCLMEISRELSRGQGSITAESSPWMTIGKEQCYSLVDSIVEREAGRYREGLLTQGPEESYKKERIKGVCRQVAWTLVEHVRQGDIQRVEFEAGFGSSPGCVFPPIRVEAVGKSMSIEGKIDRVDILKKDRAKIIDYKSGSEKFDLTEVEKGYRLQLMIYLKAVQDALDPREPGAGVFYFHIDEPLLDASEVADGQLLEALDKERVRQYRLDGMILDDEEVIRSVAGDFTDYSGICSIRATKEGIKGTGPGRLLSEEEFRKVREKVDDLLKNLWGDMITGRVPASPMKSGQATTCDYCSFKTVCGFDTAFEGCRYRVVR